MAKVIEAGIGVHLLRQQPQPQQFFIQESSTPVRVVPDLGERLVHPENNYENLSVDADEVIRSPCLGGTFTVLG